MRHKAFYQDDSRIDGSGCFIIGNWFKDDSIETQGYRRINENKYTVETEDGIFALELPYSLMNHADDPNAELVPIDNDGFELILLRDVKDGEEITIHYGEDWE